MTCESCGRPIVDEGVYSVATGEPIHLAHFRLCAPCATTLAVEIVDSQRGPELDVACDALEAVIAKRREREAVAW
jgi:hypothetical protein